jgi:2-polyprenyl-3-methyl-5-hydroxy-6-metoxy-1,4-benzoquinol methylase
MTKPISTLSPCPVCGSSQGTLLSSVDGKTGEPLTVVECCGCGLGRADPLPTDAELAAWYALRYWQDYKASVTPKLTHVLRAGRLARDRWRWAQAQQPAFKPERSIDIGASSGEFVYLMQRQGVDALGLEPHEGYSDHARRALGVRVLTGVLQQRLPELPQQHYDLVSMFHVLEHLTNPVASLRALSQLLSPGGFLLIEVPDVARLSSPKNTFFRAHTFYFSAHSLDATVRAAGLERVAFNEGRNGNLLVLLRSGSAAQAEAAAQQAAPWRPDNALVLAQQQRAWSRYLMARIRSGYLFQRLRVRRDEKATAARFSQARELLDSVYAGQVA